jgi:hypothetical protein
LFSSFNASSLPPRSFFFVDSSTTTFVPVPPIQAEVQVAASDTDESSEVVSDADQGTNTKKAPKKNGRSGISAVGYSADEHAMLLSFISVVPHFFNASETSPEWREVYKKMVEVYE